MKFSYQARTKQGDIQAGFIEASSKDIALEILREYGFYVTSLIQIRKNFWEKRITFLSEASKRDIASFTRQLSIMSKSDITLVGALESIAGQINKIGFREKVLKIADAIENGSSFSQAISYFPDTFSQFYVGMLKSGELSGKMPESLTYLADFLEREQKLLNQIITALIYPIFVLVVFSVILLIMSFFVVPSFEQVFGDMQTDLSFLTRATLWSSALIRKGWWVLLVFFAGAVGTIIFFLKKEEVKDDFDMFILRLPLAGELFKKFYLSRIALNLSTLIAGGVSISQSLETTADIVGNRVYKEVIFEVRKGVRTGRAISSILVLHSEIFPALFTQMVIVGEKTGRLEKSLRNVVEFYSEDVQRGLDMFTRFLEPLLIIVLGGMVAFLALSLFTPLFQYGLAL